MESKSDKMVLVMKEIESKTQQMDQEDSSIQTVMSTLECGRMIWHTGMESLNNSMDRPTQDNGMRIINREKVLKSGPMGPSMKVCTRMA